MVTLRTVDRRLVGPQAQPIAVGQRGCLLEGTEEDDGHDEEQAYGLEVLSVHLQLHLKTQLFNLTVIRSLFPPLKVFIRSNIHLNST